MTRDVPFVKMHGLGNDYVYLDARELRAAGIQIDDSARWSQRLADRHRGVGGDGLIVVHEDTTAPVRMEMYNADGSRAEMCGNGIRCVARLAWERGYAASTRFSIATDSGLRAVEVSDRGRTVAVDMGAATMDDVCTLTAADREFTGTPVLLGNPHFVIELPHPPAEFAVEQYGPLLERHDRFPNRANIEFVFVAAPDQILFRVWERGSGETQACGTGATAAAAALHHHGRTDTRANVALLGGDLVIEIKEGTTWMTGPAETVFAGHFPTSLTAP
ncbi:MAG: diaminopimelate epimerase [Planctomycetota bacterium]